MWHILVLANSTELSCRRMLQYVIDALSLNRRTGDASPVRLCTGEQTNRRHVACSPVEIDKFHRRRVACSPVRLLKMTSSTGDASPVRLLKLTSSTRDTSPVRLFACPQACKHQSNALPNPLKFFWESIKLNGKIL